MAASKRINREQYWTFLAYYSIVIIFSAIMFIASPLFGFYVIVPALIIPAYQTKLRFQDANEDGIKALVAFFAIIGALSYIKLFSLVKGVESIFIMVVNTDNPGWVKPSGNTYIQEYTIATLFIIISTIYLMIKASKPTYPEPNKWGSPEGWVDKNSEDIINLRQNLADQAASQQSEFDSQKYSKTGKSISNQNQQISNKKLTDLELPDD